VLVTPGERPELAALKQAGFTGYLVKPVRPISLAALLGGEQDGFDRTASETGANEPADVRAEPAKRGLAILIAEDNEINALLAQALLKRLGHGPTLATSGDAAVEAWEAAQAAGAPYDLVLMDVHMPGSDGIEAARRIRAAESERTARRTPIIALTANALDEDRDACLAAGMDGFLTKPLDRERLMNALATLPGRASLAA
jgi:CheY-like chemotaxis protein